jgi:6-phosphofructo-2-kinase/fructose-2,6-biphosphatase 2
LEGGSVAIYDATNSTKDRRKMIRERCTQENVEVFFIESICGDPGCVLRYAFKSFRYYRKECVRYEINISRVSYLLFVFADMDYSYKNTPPELAVDDFKKRIQEYEKNYQTLDEEDDCLSYTFTLELISKLM